MELMNRRSALDTAQKYLASKGIETVGIKSVKQVNGSLRGEYLPGRNRDFWIVTFSHSANVLAEIGDLNNEESAILLAVADECSTISVAVEEDGSAEVI